MSSLSISSRAICRRDGLESDVGDHSDLLPASQTSALISPRA